jgi:peroxiredoxin
MSNKLLSVLILFAVIIIILLYKQNQNLSGIIENEKGLKIGEAAYLFTATAMNGEKISIDTKNTLLIFFNATCDACRITAHQWQELYDRYQSETTSIIAISKEKKEAAEDFIVQHRLSLPIIFDSDGILQKRYNIKFSPQLVIVNKKGQIAYYHRYDVGARKALGEAETILRDLRLKELSQIGASHD